MSGYVKSENIASTSPGENVKLKAKQRIITLLLVTAAAGWLIWFEMAAGEVTAQSDPANDPKMIEAGRRHYEAHCASCHGSDGRGGERGPDIISTRTARARSTDGLIELIRKGIP